MGNKYGISGIFKEKFERKIKEKGYNINRFEKPPIDDRDLPHNRTKDYYFGIANRRTVTGWRNGTQLPNLETAKRLCEIFDCDFEYLFGEQEEERKTTKLAMEQTGLSENAVKILKEKKNDIFFCDFLSKIIENIVFPEIIEKMYQAVDCQMPYGAKCLPNYEINIQETIEHLNLLEGNPYAAGLIFSSKKRINLQDEYYDESILTAEQFSPTYTTLNRKDAADFYLQEAERKFRQIIDKICKEG